MISTKDLRELFDEATKRASDVIEDAKVPSLVRRNEPPSMLYFGIGLAAGALVGLLVAFLLTPVNGEEARQRLGEQVDRVRRGRGTIATNGQTIPTAATAQYASPTSGTYERS